jgi:hypothetical protein
MARPRTQLQTLLEAIDGPTAVYFQPKTSIEYPCIVYERDSSDVSFADNVKYLLKKGYTITVIDRSPDSPIPDQVEALSHCRFDRHFVTDGLHHFVFQLFF